MNDITTHKLASLFAKPLTEREAPGYRDVIYQPQDLKSIKGAISAGSRAVAARVEAGAADDSGTAGSGTPPGGSVWIEKSAEVVPPKGIVNSAQLEKEVCRMFANAVMFNPDPRRGLGVAFRTRARRRAAREVAGEVGDGDGKDEDEDGMEVDDGGGVVRDTREMFETVEKAVDGWRAAERVGEDGRRRAGSEVDELAGEEVEGEVESGRKRRRA